MKLRNRKFIVSVLTALMMIFTLVPGMAFADGTVPFEITGADNGSAMVNIGETKTFGISITDPDNYSDDYHIHYVINGGKQFILVTLSNDGKSFDVKGVKETSGASEVEISLHEGGKCENGACSGKTLDTKTLSVEVLNPNAPDNPWQGTKDTQEIKLVNYHMDVIDDTADPILNRIKESNEANDVIELDGKQEISFRFIVAKQGNHLNSLKFVPFVHVFPEGKTDDEVQISIKTVDDTDDNDFDVIIDANTLKPGSYTLKFDSGFYVNRDTSSLKKNIEFQFKVAPVKVTKVTLDKTAELKVGENKVLTAAVEPEDATDKTLVWTSSNEKVATVKDGKVTAVGVGTAIIKATSNDGNASAECKVTVKPVKVSKVKVNASKATVAVGSSKTLKALVYPSNATNKTVTWKSSNSKIAKVSSTGKVTAVKPGKATVTVTTKDGSFKAKTVINVIPKSTTFKLYAKKHSIAIKYKKIKGVSGYEVYRASSKDGKYKKVTTRLQRYPDTYTSIWLRSDKTYYYKIRTYKTVDGKKIYSKFSEVKKIRTK